MHAYKYTCIHTYMHMHTYIYIYDKQRHTDTYMYIYMYTYHDTVLYYLLVCVYNERTIDSYLLYTAF